MTDADRQDEIRELLALYALQQLDERDQVRVERALAADPELRRELGSFEHVSARLAESMPSTTAPASIKQSVMASVRASAAHRNGGTLEDIADAAASARPTPARDRARRRWFATPVFSGAMAAACLLLAVVALNANRDLNAAERRADRLQAAANERGGPPAGFEDATPHTVSTNGPFEQSTGSLIQVSKNKWILLFNDVPNPSAGNSWQVWTADSNGLIENVAQWKSGDTQLLVLDRADIKQVMVSYEPTTRPAPVPSSEPVADVKV
ncbi:MAG: hypothetical protein JWL76_38 [Thermoleophilia bacterium]|nr:hypothetical protein [Thermoleophilia bacterium]